MSISLRKFIFAAIAGLLSATILPAQSPGNVTGRIVDEEGVPVVGAAVYYEGTSTAAVSGADGEFSIKFIKDKELIVSCIGMENQNLKPDPSKPLSIVMTADANLLEDAVVIGYGTVSRKDLTGSVSSIKADDISKSGSNNALGALQGRVAGLSITSQSGEPGSGFNIKIRGNNSINAGTTPLFVIDGMQMDLSSSVIASSSSTGYGTYDPLSFINPADIESVEVLKDASATAIYGASGANGVVIITTKSGVSGHERTTVNFDATVGLSENPRHIEMTDGQEYIDYRFARGDYGYDSFALDLDGDGKMDTAKNAANYECYDWQKELYRKAVSQSYNLSINSKLGGGTQISTSLGYLNNQGLIRNNSHQRYTARVKLDHKINNIFTTGLTVNYGRTLSHGAVSSGGGSLGYSGIVQYIYLERPIALWYSGEADEFEGIFGLKSLITDKTFRKTTYDRLTANAFVKAQLNKDWSIRLNGSGGLSKSELLEFYSVNSKWGRAKNGVANDNNTATYNFNVNLQLNYAHTWKKSHRFDAMAAGEMTYFNSSVLNLNSYNFEDESTGVYDLSKASIQAAPVKAVEESAKLSFISRANYNYLRRYYITATFRIDGSSRFQKGHRIGYFPSVSLAWRIGEEPWMKKAANGIVDEFKLRFSVGASGNDRIGNYASLATLGTNYYSAIGTEMIGMAPTNSQNPSLKWETTYQYDAGVDLSLFKERLNLVMDFYYKDTRNMLYRATLPAQSGFNLQWQNLGRVENKGVEIALNTHNIDTRDFSWSSSLTFDLSRNKVLDIGGVDYTTVSISGGQLASDISRIVVGEPIGIGWGYVCVGNYQLDDFIITKNGREYPAEAVTSANIDSFEFTLKDGVTNISTTTPQPGDRKYKDLDGDNDITTNDRTKISDSNPKFTMGFGNTFTYKNFDLNIFLEGVYGRQILNEFKLRSESGAVGGTQSNSISKAAWYGHWTPENASNTYSSLRNRTNSFCSSYYVEDGSFLRIKTISLGYSLPYKYLEKAKMRSLRLGFSVDNAFCFTKYSGNDPDVSSSNVLFPGFDRMSYPKARTYSFNLSFGF